MGIMDDNVINGKDYTLLKDFRMIYSDITSSAPFISINEKKLATLLPLSLLHKEASDPSNSTSLTEALHASMENEFPLENWIHVGCGVFTEVLRLHINGEIAGEWSLPSSFNKDSISNGLEKITLVGASGDDDLQGYVYNAEVLPISLSIKYHYFKDPPLQLSIDDSSTSEIEEGIDGIWSIVGGKASCRRIFSLDVVLSNAISVTIDKEVEVVASLLYADNGLPVEKTSDDEAPLLISYDGIEFAASDQQSIFSSNSLHISESSNILAYLEKTTSASYPLNGSAEFQHNSVHEIKPSPSSKRVKLGQENTSAVERQDDECNLHACTANQVENALRSKLEGSSEKIEVDNSPSDSESIEERDSDFKVMSSSGYSISDLTIFKYCLGGLTDRALLLKEVAISASEEDLLRFAHEVSLYSGCSHHKRQITIAKRLIMEGTRVWNSIAQNNHAVHWENVVFEIEEQFMKIACCSSRSLTEQDFELLRRIAGCRDYIAQENFEKMWCWLYPVAFALSRDWINTMWKSTFPKWIEGFITEEEAELSLEGPRGLQEPGTFVLRFPTSRSWPHPDAGSLIVTYVGSDYAVHHRLLCLDFIYRREAGFVQVCNNAAASIVDVLLKKTLKLSNKDIIGSGGYGTVYRLTK
ncbi:hypothetical protein GH714_026632 [Hevea brasiliensis]|uniref:SH2 domain-containing protein n=1 Tax=Hevea brasiliensis TaxID=3981 RepID=A0A6A6MN88_HEVBR|nr:hypothetical protein GH714_026632 [Hevea brasiliensis]